MMDKKQQGKRINLVEDENYQGLQQGEYGKNEFGWYFSPPTDDFIGVGGLGKHTIIEHDDGTITVSPSIAFKSHMGAWHGYLKQGVWEEV